MQSLEETLVNLEIGGKHIHQEFQDYGVRLAQQLNDPAHVSLYIKIARDENRGLVQDALTFVLDSHARSKGKLFMWKLKQLRDEQVNKSQISN